MLPEGRRNEAAAAFGQMHVKAAAVRRILNASDVAGLFQPVSMRIG